jgi:mannobiose 2-epimerase
MEKLNMSLSKRKMNKYLFRTIILLFTFSFVNCIPSDKSSASGDMGKVQTDRDTIASEIQKLLKSEFDLWYPLVIDTVYGGYFSDVNYKWQLDGPQDKMIVTQARHIWSVSNAAQYYKNNVYLLKVAAHGFKFLKNVMWDKEFGGFYNLVNREGQPLKEVGQLNKQVYGNAFAIYGLAAYYKVSKDIEALKLAQETFRWIEKHSYDPVYGGYFQFMSREGIPFKDGFGGVPPKDQNSSIHLLECFTELYEVWPDPVLKERLSSMLEIIRDKITTKKGNLTLYFSQDWVPATNRRLRPDDKQANSEFDHVSFGHDIETAYLLLEASNVLGIKNDTTTLKIAKRMVDHSYTYGMDKENWGLFDEGSYSGQSEEIKIIKKTKEWWAQAEAMNSFLMMSELFPGEKLPYYEKFCNQWNYIKKYLIDPKYGGWYWGGIDIMPGNIYAYKGSIWKCNYHTSRALINCLKRLRNNDKLNLNW